MVLNEEGFNVSSLRAAEALSMAEELIAWCQDKAHQELFMLFAQLLVGALKTCSMFPPGQQDCKVRRYVISITH